MPIYVLHLSHKNFNNNLRKCMPIKFHTSYNSDLCEEHRLVLKKCQNQQPNACFRSYQWLLSDHKDENIFK